MTATVERYEVEACEDCVLALSGVADDLTAERLAELDEGRAKLWPDAEGWHLVPDCPEDCEGGFSWSPCAVCGSPLGGHRHPVAVWRDNDERMTGR